MSNEITVISSSEETTGWTRRIILTYKGKVAYVRMYYSEGNGYETSAPDFKGEWSVEETKEFHWWLLDHDNLYLLDELTSY